MRSKRRVHRAEPMKRLCPGSTGRYETPPSTSFAGVARRTAHTAFARELETHETPSTDMETEICACVSRLAATLKPEYAEALQAIEVTGTPVKAYAEQKGLSSSNAAVRVFRARKR